MSIVEMGRVLASLTSPLSATVIQSAGSWLAKSRSIEMMVNHHKINMLSTSTDEAKRFVELLQNAESVSISPGPSVNIDGVKSQGRIKIDKIEADSGDIEISKIQSGQETVQEPSPPPPPPPPPPPIPGKRTKSVIKKSTLSVDAANVVTDTKNIIVSPVFKLVFLTIVCLTVASGAAAVAMAFVTTGAQPNQQAAFDSMNTAWKLGLGAIFGLLGGKTA